MLRNFILTYPYLISFAEIPLQLDIFDLRTYSNNEILKCFVSEPINENDLMKRKRLFKVNNAIYI